MTDLRKMSNEELLQELCNTLQSVGTYRGPRTDAEGKMIMRATGLQVEILSRLDGAAPSEGMKPELPTVEQLAQRMAYQHPDMGPEERQRQWEKIPVDNPWRKQWLDTANLVLEFIQSALSPARSGEPTQCPECHVPLRDETAHYRCDKCHARYSSSLERGLYRLPDDRIVIPAAPQPVSGDAQKVEEIARQLNHKFGFHSSRVLTYEGALEFLRPYFNLASTTWTIDPENYVAWCRRSKNTIVTCDSDAPGAFKVYRLAAPGSVPQAPTNPEDVPDLYRLAYMPGVWRCPKCEFVLSKATISMSSASIGTTPEDRQSEQCPNDGEWMVPVTYKESLKQCQDRLIQELERGVPQAEPPKERTITLAALWHLLFPEGTEGLDFVHNDVGEWLDHYTEEIECHAKRIALAGAAQPGDDKPGQKMSGSQKERA